MGKQSEDIELQSRLRLARVGESWGDHDAPTLDVHRPNAFRNEREHESRIELEHVVRGPRGHVDDAAELSSLLVLDRQADELEDVVRPLLRRRELVDGDLDHGASRHRPVEANHEAAASRSLGRIDPGGLSLDVDPSADLKAGRILARALDDE